MGQRRLGLWSHCPYSVIDIVEEGYKILVHLDFFFLSVGALVNEDEKKTKKFRQGPTWVQIDLYLYYWLEQHHTKNNFLHAGRKEIYILCFSLHFFFLACCALTFVKLQAANIHWSRSFTMGVFYPYTRLSLTSMVEAGVAWLELFSRICIAHITMTFPIVE